MKKVLLIDDEEVIRNRMKKVIEKEGYETFIASGGREGMEIFAREDPDLVITDLMMPDMDGMEVMHLVKKASPGTEVILITGYGEYEMAVQALREGALDYLKKPIDIDQLIISLGRCKERSANRVKLSSQINILIADDEKLARGKLERIFTKEGYNVFTAENGKEALDIFNHTKIDIVLTDLKMPVMGGIELLHEIKKLTDDVEVILLTGYGNENIAIQAMREGALNFLTKPIDIEQMIASIEKAQEKLQLKRSLLYRTRDLELARELLSIIALQNDIMIDISAGQDKPAAILAQQLIDAMPFHLFVADKESNIAFANKRLVKLFETKPETVNSSWADKLSRIGINDLTIEHLKQHIEDSLNNQNNEVTEIKTGQYSYIILTKIKVITATGIQDLALVILRGEHAK